MTLMLTSYTAVRRPQPTDADWCQPAAARAQSARAVSTAPVALKHTLMQ